MFGVAPPQQRPDPSQPLLQRERLGQIVIGPGVQANWLEIAMMDSLLGKPGQGLRNLRDRLDNYLWFSVRTQPEAAACAGPLHLMHRRPLLPRSRSTRGSST
jgi:hypothetical protein